MNCFKFFQRKPTYGRKTFSIDSFQFRLLKMQRKGQGNVVTCNFAGCELLAQ